MSRFTGIAEAIEAPVTGIRLGRQGDPDHALHPGLLTGGAGAVRARGITTMDRAHRFLKEGCLSEFAVRFVKGPEDDAAALMPLAGSVRAVPYLREERSVGNDNTGALQGPGAAGPARSRPGRWPTDRNAHREGRATRCDARTQRPSTEADNRHGTCTGQFRTFSTVLLP